MSDRATNEDLDDLRTPPLRLVRPESLDLGLSRVLCEQLDVVSTALAGDQHEIGTAVHLARRTLKKIRALVRLIASGNGGGGMAAPLIDLRDAGRALAPLRDADVLATIVSEIGLALPAHHDAQSLASLERILVARRESVFEGARDGAFRVTAARHTAAARRTIETWKPTDIDFDLIRVGIAEWYGRGRNAMVAACDGGDAKRFHTWRKRTKDVRHQTEFLSPVAPDVMAAAEDLHRLTDMLGEANDLGQLEAMARLHDPVGFSASCREFRLLADKRKGLWSDACSLGSELFAEQPDEHTSVLERSWRRWVTQGSAPAEVGQG